MSSCFLSLLFFRSPFFLRVTVGEGVAWGLAVFSNLLYRNQLLDSMANMAAAERPHHIYDDVVSKLASCNKGIVMLNQQLFKNADSLMNQSGISTALAQLTSGSITSILSYCSACLLLSSHIRGRKCKIGRRSPFEGSLQLRGRRFRW